MKRRQGRRILREERDEIKLLRRGITLEMEEPKRGRERKGREDT